MSSAWNVSASPFSYACLIKPVHPSRQFGCYPEERVSDSSFPPTSGVGTTPEWSHNAQFTLWSVTTLYTIRFLSVCFSFLKKLFLFISFRLSVSLDYELLEINSLRSLVPRGVYDSMHIYCMNKAVYPLPIYTCLFNFLDSVCKMPYFFSPLNLILLLLVFSLYGF